MWTSLVQVAFLAVFCADIGRFPTVDGEAVKGADDDLITFLFTNYTKLSRPVANASETVQVQIQFYIERLNSLDTLNQILYLNGHLETGWTDQRLKWTKSDYDEIEQLTLRADQVWLPDIAVENNAGTPFTSDYYQSYYPLEVYHNGRVIWHPAGEFASSCLIDLTYYPFDYQSCEMIWECWSSLAEEVNLTTINSAMDLTNYHVNGEWSIASTSVKSETTTHADTNGSYSTVHFTVNLKRKPLYFVNNIITPCVLLSVLMAFVFLIPPDEGEKIGLGLTVLLSFSVFQLIVSDSLPKTSDQSPIISIYVTVVLILSGMSLTGTMLVFVMHFHGGSKKAPSWLRKFFFNGIAYIVCARSHVRTLSENQVEPMDDDEKRVSVVSLSSGLKKQQPLKPDEKKSQEVILLEKILLQLEKLTAVEDGKTQDAETTDEWVLIAKILDRFLFLLFMVALVICTTTILGIIPNHGR